MRDLEDNLLGFGGMNDIADRMTRDDIVAPRTEEAIAEANERAVQRLLAGDEYHHVAVTSESVGQVLIYLKQMLDELRQNDFSAAPEDTVIAISMQEDGDQPSAAELARRSYQEKSRVGVASPDQLIDGFEIAGVDVKQTDDLPPGVAVAISSDAVAPTPPGVLRPFTVRNRDGIVVRNFRYIDEGES